MIGNTQVLAYREGAGEVKVDGIGVVVGDLPLHGDVGVCVVVLGSVRLCCALTSMFSQQS